MEKTIPVKSIKHIIAILAVVFTFGFCTHLIYVDTDKGIIRDYSNATEDGWKYIKLYE